MGYSAKSSKRKVVVLSCADAVDQLIKAKAHTEIADRLVGQFRPIVEKAALSEREFTERSGGFCKTVDLRGTKGSAHLTFGNRFCQISKADEKELKRDLGDRLFSELFTEKLEARIKPEKVKDLIDLLGSEAKDYLDVQELLVPVSEFREKRFELRSELSDDLNSRLDEVIERIAAKPSLKVKSKSKK